MKLKYKVAVKFYTETKNEEQLEYAYREIESFKESYKNFKWYHKFNFENTKKEFSLELELDPEIEILVSENSEFILFLDRYKLKLADSIFQQGNYNIDLVKYAIDKVLKRDGENKRDVDIKSLIISNAPSKCKLFSINEDTSSNISLVLWASLVILSVALIFTHLYMYMKNPLKFFKGING